MIDPKDKKNCEQTSRVLSVQCGGRMLCLVMEGLSCARLVGGF